MSPRMQGPAHWRLKGFRYKLTGHRCDDCGEFHYSPRIFCRRCRSRKLSESSAGMTGRVLSFTVINYPPSGFEAQSPYVLAVVETEAGTRILAQLTDCTPEDVKSGMEVEATFRKIREDGLDGMIAYGYKFRPRIGEPRGTAETPEPTDAA